MMKNKNRLYLLSLIPLTALLAALHTAALLTAYDPEVGYFESTPLVLVMRILYIVGAAWCVALPFALPKGTPYAQAYAIPHNAIRYSAAALFIFSGIVGLAKSLGTANLSTPSTSAILPILSILTALASAFFFAQPKDAKKPSAVHASCGFLVLAFLFCFLFHVYFYMYVTINSTLKTMLQLSVLSAMLFTLFEIRHSLGKPMPRIAIAPRLLCVLFCIPTAIAHLCFGASALCGTLERTVISPTLSLPLLALGIFALSELIFHKE